MGRPETFLFSPSTLWHFCYATLAAWAGEQQLFQLNALHLIPFP